LLAIGDGAVVAPPPPQLPWYLQGCHTYVKKLKCRSSELGYFFESYLKIKENIISAASIFCRIGVGLQMKDMNPTSNPTLNLTPNPTLGVVEITGLTNPTSNHNINTPPKSKKSCPTYVRIHKVEFKVGF
jgi:hypothetical protein